jgi:peptidyl-prolyl cis-trans isomerase A (cyclophilin A)
MNLRFLAIAAILGAPAAACSTTPTPASVDPRDAGTGNVEAVEPAEPAEPSEQRIDAGDAAVVPEGPNPMPECPRDPGPPTLTVDASSKTDPTGGAEKFTIEQALAGYPAVSGVLTALISTEKSAIRCELAEAAAPISVANFVGLARGTRPFKTAGKWKLGRFYDGLLWHRVIPDFMIQGGDPLGKGTGGPGYDLVDENHVEEPLGTLAMAASSVPSGSQFFVVVGKGPAPNYNVFGSCSTEAAIAIAAEPRDAKDKPLTDVHMTRIDIARCPK